MSEPSWGLTHRYISSCLDSQVFRPSHKPQPLCRTTYLWGIPKSYRLYSYSRSNIYTPEIVVSSLILSSWGFKLCLFSPLVRSWKICHFFADLSHYAHDKWQSFWVLGKPFNRLVCHQFSSRTYFTLQCL